MQEILDMTSALNTTQVGPSGSSADTYDWINAGVPGGNLMNENQNYFIFHHSEGELIGLCYNPLGTHFITCSIGLNMNLSIYSSLSL